MVSTRTACDMPPIIRGGRLCQRPTVVPRSWLVQRALAAPLEPKCAIDEDVIAINSAWLAEVLAEGKTGDEPAYKLQRYAIARAMISGAIQKRVGAKRLDLSYDWRKLVDAELGALPTSEANRKDEERARREKAASLRQIAQSRFSVLVGPVRQNDTAEAALRSAPGE